MSNTDSKIQKAIELLNENCTIWFKDDLVSIIYFPTDEELENSYFYFLIILNSIENLNSDFWINYYRNIESKWDSYWIKFFDSELMPKLSINLRSQKSIEDKLLLSNTPEEPYQILFDKNNFFKTNRDLVVNHTLNGIVNLNGDTIWI